MCVPAGVCVCVRQEIHVNSLRKRARLKVKSGSKQRRSRERLEVVSRAAAGLGGPGGLQTGQITKNYHRGKRAKSSRADSFKKGTKNPVFAAHHNEMENQKC